MTPIDLPPFAPEEIDYRVREEGGLILLWPVSDECVAWIAEHVQDGQTWGHAIVIPDPDVAAALTAGMASDGLVGGLA